MADSRYEELVDFLTSELGDELHAVISYDEDTQTVQYETEFVAQFFDEVAEVAPENLHQNMVLESMQHTLDQERYGVNTYCGIAISEDLIKCHLIQSESKGVVVLIDGDASIPVPGFIDSCMERLES